jgi:hypothetical protein
MIAELQASSIKRVNLELREGLISEVGIGSNISVMRK